jgi:Holliday junction resolvasome RuvABC endonuclease subunit
VIVVGLDLSLSSTGVALPGRTLALRTNLRGEARLAYQRRELAILLKRVGPDLAVLEGYAYGANDAGSRANTELGGVVRLLLYDLGIPYCVVNPTTLKLFATGHGRASKDDMAMAARRHAAFDAPTDDEVDAWWCRVVGLHIAGRPPFPLPERQRAALAKVAVPAGIRRRAHLMAAPS